MAIDLKTILERDGVVKYNIDMSKCTCDKKSNKDRRKQETSECVCSSCKGCFYLYSEPDGIHCKLFKEAGAENNCYKGHYIYVKA